MDVLREREVKDSLERQLQDEQKVRGEYKSTRYYPFEIARGVSFYEASNRDDLSRVYKWHPTRFASPLRTALRKMTWPANNASRRPRARDSRHTVISQACIGRLGRVFEAEA